MARLWHGSKWLRIGCVVLLLGLVALAIPFLIPVDRFRPLIVRLVEASTAREVEIDALRLHLVPTIRIRAINIRVKQPNGFGVGNAVTVESVDFKVAPAALLARRLDVTDITISGVRVNLLRDAAGRMNFELSPLPIVPPDGPGSTAGRAPFLSLDRVGAVTVKNVEITLANSDSRRAQVAPSLTLSGLNVRIRSFDPNTSNWPRKLEIATDLRGATLTTPLLAKPVQFQTGELLFNGGAGRGTFSATLGTMHAEGTAAFASLDPLSVTFTVAIPILDVDMLEGLAIRSTLSSAAPTPQRLMARGEVKIGRFVLSPLEATRMSGRLSVYTRTIQLDSYALSAYGGTMEGTAALDYSAASLPATMIAKVRGVSLGRVVSTIFPRARKVTGALDVDLRLATAMGPRPRATLTGAGTFAMRDGSVEGLNFKSSLAKLAGVLQPDVPGGATRFSYFGGDLRIAQQRVYSVSLRLEAEGMEGAGGGSFGIDKTLDYVGTGVLKNRTSETSRTRGASRSLGRRLGDVLRGAAVTLGVRVPFSLRGTFDDPQFSLARTPQPTQDQDTRQQRQQQLQQPKQPSSQDLH